jgi:hypothetical protein
LAGASSFQTQEWFQKPYKLWIESQTYNPCFSSGWPIIPAMLTTLPPPPPSRVPSTTTITTTINLVSPLLYLF